MEKKSGQSSQLVEVESRFIDAVVSESKMLEAWQRYERLQKSLATPEDFVTFRSRSGATQAAPTKKWRVKLERFFGVSVSIVERQVIPLANGEYLFIVKARAEAPQGAYHEAEGACSTEEKLFSKERKYHDALTHAETRAKNRAIFEFVGGGEVSAEELAGSPDYSYPPEKQNNKPSQKQLNLIHMLAQSQNKGMGWSEEQYKTWLERTFGVQSAKALTREQATKAIDSLNDYVKNLTKEEQTDE